MNRITLLSISTLLLFVSIAHAKKDHKYPFDPSTIPTSSEWEELLKVEDGFYPSWCGTEKVFFRSYEKGFRVLDVPTKKVSTLQLDEEFRYKFKGCLPGGRYIVFKKEYRQPEYQKFIVVYDSETGEEVHSSPLKEEKLSYISPNGKYLGGYEDGEIRFGKNKITLVPLYKDLPVRYFGYTWSPDSKTIYILTNEKKRRLVVYDVETRTSKGFFLERGEHGIIGLMVSPDGKTLYFRGILREFVADYLYRLKVDQLRNENEVVKPEFLRNGIDGFDLDPGNKMVLNKVTMPDRKSWLPFEFAGIYLADMDGKVTSRLTSGHYDTYPKFSRDGLFILFDRIEIIKPGNWAFSVHLFKKNK